MVMFIISEVCNCDLWIGYKGKETFSDPFKGATLAMISTPQDAIVPLTEIVLLLIEELKFGNEEAIEVSKHER